MAPRRCWPVVLALCLAGGVVRGQTAADPFYTKNSLFRIPYTASSGQGRLKQIQLYVSTDQGHTWQAYVTVAPEQRHFDFRAQRDGSYWFTVRTVDVDNRAYPVTMEHAKPELRVIVDTVPPAIRLKTLTPRDGEVGVDWDVRDENLDPGSLKLEYRLVSTNDWYTVAPEIAASGSRYWRPNTNSTIEVRLRAKDRAENSAEQTVNLTPTPSTGRSGPERSETVVPRATDGVAVRMVNSKRISLNYNIEGQGPSGVSKIELWCTQDPAGRSWQKAREQDGRTKPPLVVDVQGEGVYGFSLVVTSGVGLGDHPPQVGDQPQVWVQVDLTPPEVHLTNAEVGQGADSGRLFLSWNARDENFGKGPITLTYSEVAGGPWKPIESKLENTGNYVWQMPKDVPYKFFVRIEAADRAGNVGSDTTPETRPVIVDLAKPKGVIVNVESLGAKGN